MTNKEYLEMELRMSVQEYGEDAPVTQNIKRQLREMQEKQPPYLQQFQAGFRKAKTPKRCKA